MKVYSIVRNQFLPLSQKEAWDFFSTPKNLALITPARMNFKILSQSGSEKMFAGQIITYTISVLPFIRVRWVTEITQVEEPNYFTDVQRSGPCKMWNHTHRFKALEKGVEMSDEVKYAMPLGWLGQAAHAVFVEGEINRIFEYRFSVLQNLFKNRP